MTTTTTNSMERRNESRGKPHGFMVARETHYVGSSLLDEAGDRGGDGSQA
eukprot:CAMPEP_0169404072 /NCGR_PEP_ID=MMETSP1017-20121227/56138_1 /TAXON_ID=342587 /ORGANISM="Karlodinium micrum, Strain CCMP2283" /LENGTH=49 /DNA_ID= /DNA_START= /DNA_END= /DNA_ORIENTATION=